MFTTTREEEFVVELNQTSKQKHLCLAPSRNGFPGIKSVRGDRREGNTFGEVTWKTKSSTNNPPTDEGSHGNTSVLNFRMTEPGNGFVGTKIRKTQRIPFASEFNGVGGSKDSITAHAGVGRFSRSGRFRLGSGFLFNLSFFVGHEDRLECHLLLLHRCKGGGGACSGKDKSGRELHLFLDLYLLNRPGQLQHKTLGPPVEKGSS
mmetsp:Transcript_28688/g.40262  ORF Transcript_28688/g.40262 Transcript_28688/m.40262 type:complete len:205 (-) Transcript_28688:8-622(-)